MENITKALNTRDKGSLAELRIGARLMELGYCVSFPYGAHAAYDIIADDGERLIKVEVKFARIKRGALEFNTERNSGSKYNNVDFFGVFSPDNNKCYLIPTKDATWKRMVIRVEKPKNNQSKGIVYAEKYAL